LRKLIFWLLLVGSVPISVSAQEGEVSTYQFGSAILGAVNEGSEVKPVEDSQWTDEAKLWLARSCAGEAGFGALEECSGIAWVYATRATATGVKFVDIVREYSAAVKKDNRPGRQWILGLRLDGRYPKDWPKRLSWKKHRVWWERMLEMLDLWAEGKIVNPVESANHFGGSMDVPWKSWKRITPVSQIPFRNRFYRSR